MVELKPTETPAEHAISKKDFPKIDWKKCPRADLSRLPSLHHILFVVIDSEQETNFFEILKKPKKVRVKYINNLGAFLICESESLAFDLFHHIKEHFYVFCLKSMPKEIKIDALRGEICFMEGVRPQKTTVVAERFIKRHLGYKN